MKSSRITRFVATKPAPSLRLLQLLEIVCAHGRPFSLADAIEASGWPKPSVHRMRGQPESGGLLESEPDDRCYTWRPTC
ncbi:MAG: helix-turn-helix domain-containing protein [Acidovorax sp.]|uniref:helix-turn-helix domain-containing protein n=1 Tax=Acidovorax sp. TaxID=1872122 RepID=UPI003919BA53